MRHPDVCPGAQTTADGVCACAEYRAVAFLLWTLRAQEIERLKRKPAATEGTEGGRG